MCKIVVFTNAKNVDSKKASETIGNILLNIEKDGYGYAVQGETNVYGEKCIAPSFKSRMGLDNLVTLPIIQKRQESFGTKEKPIGPALFHGRTSTNDKGLLNCHPMQRDSWHLIHNGVVNNSGPVYNKYTTNDSEDLLHRLIEGIEHVEKDLSGYYAFAAIDPDGNLHIARDDQASLFMAWCPSIQSFIFATTESLIDSVTDKLKIKVGPIDKVEDNIYMIFQGNTLVHKQTIFPRGFDYRQADLASLSLGRSLDYGNPYSYGQDFESEALWRELDNMDDTYTIEFNHEQISVDQYYKLDEVSQMECIIMRPDGTWIDLNEQLYKEIS